MTIWDLTTATRSSLLDRPSLTWVASIDLEIKFQTVVRYVNSQSGLNKLALFRFLVDMYVAKVTITCIVIVWNKNTHLSTRLCFIDSIYIQVDFGSLRLLKAVATQGRSYDRFGDEGLQWVTEYRLLYSIDCVTFTPYKNADESDKVFTYLQNRQMHCYQLFCIKYVLYVWRILSKSWAKRARSL